MTDYRKQSNTDGWIRSNNRSHNHDFRVVALVQLLARQAAQEDYDDLLMNIEEQGPAREQKETLQ